MAFGMISDSRHFSMQSSFVVHKTLAEWSWSIYDCKWCVTIPGLWRWPG